MEGEELPKGWVWSHLEGIALINPRHPANILDDDTPVSFVPMTAISEDNWRIKANETRPFGKVRKGYTHFAEGDVLFAKITPCMENGKAAIAKNLVNGIGCGTTELHVIRPQGNIPPEFIYYYIHQELFREKAAAHMTGTAGQLRVPVDFIKSALIPLPPLPEQRILVARVESLLERVKKAKQELDKIPEIIKKFHQSVLKQAMSGRLTADWRERHPDVEPASELLKRIQEERLWRYEEEVKRAKAEGRKKPRKPKNLDVKPLDASDLSEVPDGWVWVKLSEVCKKIQDGSHFSPPNGPKGEVGPDGEVYSVPYITAKNIKCNGIDLSELTYVSLEVHRKIYQRCDPKPGDVLYIKDGATTGIAVINNLNFEFSMLSSVAMLRPEKYLIPEFLCYYLNCPDTFNRMTSKMTGTAINRIILDRIRNAEISLPPLEEQKEIVCRIEKLFKFADEVEKQVKEAQKQVEKISQSILTKAFRGELTADFRYAIKNWKNLDIEERKKYLIALPENDREKVLYSDEFPIEPASVLLERIRAERERKKKESRRLRRKKSGQITLFEI